MNGNESPQGAPAGGFDFNRPTIIALLYIASTVLGVTALVGVVLAYVWKGEVAAAWEASHYSYLIRTFWLGLIGGFIGVLTLIVGIGFLILLATAVLVIVRSVLSLIAAQKCEAMPKPDTWLA